MQITTHLSKAIIALSLLIALPAQAIQIEFDYTYDTNGFFTDQATGTPLVDRRSLLEQAASFYTGFTDTLSPISPNATDTWSAQILNPSAPGTTVTLDNQAIAADTLRIYVGASRSGSGTLGFAGGFSLSASGSQSFIDSVITRGQDNTRGDTASDFGVWGGMIWFNAANDWYFGTDTSGLTNSNPDFLTTATHEIGHILGFGSAESWMAQVNDNGDFIGENAVAAYGSAIPLDAIAGHWAEGTMSTYDGLLQETLMDPSVIIGQRKLPTVLDYAAFADIGWEVTAVPEPSSYVLFMIGLGLMGLRQYRRRA